jgi:SPP1 gp7 family putative phage head morphogenesis protein
MRALVARWKEAVRRIALPLAKAVTEDTRTDADDAGLGALDVLGHQLADSAALSRATKGVADKAFRHSKTEFGRLGIKIREAEPTFGKKITAWRAENVGLVKSLFGDEKKKLGKILREGEGRRYESLAKDIEARLDVTQRKAEFLAIDQTLKLNADITRARMGAAGITEYVWTTAGDERVRPTHEELDGETFSFDDPPVTNEDGDRNNPGEDYRCRCVAYPVLPELDDDETEAGGAGDGGGEKPPTPAEPSDDEEPSGLTEGVHASSIVFDGISRELGEAILSDLHPDDLALLETAPIQKLSLLKQARIDGDPVNGSYHFGTKELALTADRPSWTYGSGPLQPGRSWSISSAAATEREAAQHTFTHELGHHVHGSADKYGEATNLIIRAFTKAKQAGTVLTQYARSSHFEYFAESYAAYRHHGEVLLRHDPIGHKMVEDVLKLPRRK